MDDEDRHILCSYRSRYCMASVLLGAAIVAGIPAILALIAFVAVATDRLSYGLAFFLLPMVGGAFANQRSAAYALPAHRIIMD